MLLAFIGTQNGERPARFFLVRLAARAKALLFDGSEASRTRRIVGTSFLIRVAGAVLAYASQILLAVWMGTFQFGIYVYVWTWVTLLVGFIDLGMSSAAQRFIPQYSHRNESELLRGFQSGSRWLVLTLASVVAIVGALSVSALQSWLNDYEVLPL